MFFDERITGYYWQPLKYWWPTLEMFPADRARDRRWMAALRGTVGNIPILMWQGRAGTSPSSNGIVRVSIGNDFLQRWRNLSTMAPRSNLMVGAEIEAIMLPRLYTQESLSIDFPGRRTFSSHIKIRPDHQHSIYAHYIANLGSKCLFINMIHSVMPRIEYRVGAVMMFRAMQLCRALGLRRVELVAGLARGGSTWPKYGFRPSSRAQWLRCRETVQRNVERLSQDPVASGPLATVRDEIDRLLSSSEAKTIWQLSRLRGQILTDEGARSLGEVVLRGTKWRGTLDLDDAEALEFLNARVRNLDL